MVIQVEQSKKRRKSTGAMMEREQNSDIKIMLLFQAVDDLGTNTLLMMKMKKKKKRTRF